MLKEAYGEIEAYALNHYVYDDEIRPGGIP